MNYTRAVPMSRIIHTLLGRVYLPQHMVVVGTSTSMSLRKISTSSIIITREHVTMPILSVRTYLFINDALKKFDVRRGIFFSTIHFEAKEQI